MLSLCDARGTVVRYGEAVNPKSEQGSSGLGYDPLVKCEEAPFVPAAYAD
jgi:hypothetical protein